VRDRSQVLLPEPGELVPSSFAKKWFDNSLHCVFAENELVAVERDDEGGFHSELASGLKTFAKFRGYVSSAEGDASAGNQLTRKYLLFCGDLDEEDCEKVTEHSHLTVYKITRSKVLAGCNLPPAPHSSLVPVPTPHPPVPPPQPVGGSSIDDIRRLLATLQTMMTLTTEEVKRAARRLYMQWHPDKCKLPHAARCFRYTCQFVQLHERGCERGDLEHVQAFLASLRPEEEEERDFDHQQPYVEQQPHTWLSQFEKERVAPPETPLVSNTTSRLGAGAAAGAAGRGAGGSIASGGGASGNGAGCLISGGGGLVQHQDATPVAQAPPKLKDERMADVEWVTAQEELHVAQLLSDAQLWSTSVFHSHQAAEHTLKAVLLRTCGVTGEEFRGTTGHNLASLMDQLGGDAPLSAAKLQRLSKAYLGTRYPVFPPTAAPTLPSAAFSAVDAQEALEQASRLLEWARTSTLVQGTEPLAQLPQPPPHLPLHASNESDAAHSAATPLTVPAARLPPTCAPIGLSELSMSEADVGEAGRRAAAEERAAEAELENQRLREQLERLRKEASEALEAAQRASDEDKARVVGEMAATHAGDMQSLRTAAEAELFEVQQAAEKHKQALRAYLE